MIANRALQALGLSFALTLAGLAPLAAAETAPGAGIDPNLPIEISANSFEVQPKSQVGIFQGNVEVVQGPITLRADRIDVHYQDQDQGGSGQSVERLEAKGRVRVSSPEEEAQSEWATYDVANQLVTMGGGVLLTRGPNILEGAKLTIDLKTNVSRIDPGTPEAPAVGAVPGNPGRVRALLTPPQDEKPAQDKKKDGKTKDDTDKDSER